MKTAWLNFSAQKTKGLLFVATLIFIICHLTCSAQTASQRLDSLFTTLANNNEFNGSVLVTENGKVIYQHSFGYADAEHQLLNSEKTAFNLASISKGFTTVSILQLKQKHQLSIDDHYIKYFPDFPYPEITIRQLLSNTSGLPDNQIFEKPYQENPNKIYTLDDMITALKNDKRGLFLSLAKNLVIPIRDWTTGTFG